MWVSYIRENTSEKTMCGQKIQILTFIAKCQYVQYNINDCSAFWWTHWISWLSYLPLVFNILQNNNKEILNKVFHYNQNEKKMYVNFWSEIMSR